MCIYIYIYIFVYLFMYAYIYTHIHTYHDTYIYIYIHTYMHTHTCTYIYTYVYICIYTSLYIYIYMYIHNVYIDRAAEQWITADLRIKILDSRGFDSSRILILRGWNSRAHREFPGSFESSNLSRDNLIGLFNPRGQCLIKGSPL